MNLIYPSSFISFLIILGGLFFSEPQSAHACGWHYETIRAEAKSLPCTQNVSLNAYPRYTDNQLKQKRKVASLMSLLLPTSLLALDEITVTSILLKDLPQAQCALKQRQIYAPNAYETLANLGTYYTFSGELDLAQQSVQKIVDQNPKAHFGREQDHLLLIQYLKKNQEKKTFDLDLYGRSFKHHLRSLWPKQPKTKKELLHQEAALVSMISIYGAENNPYLYATLGMTLKQKGSFLLAASAFDQAIRLRHPQRKYMRRWLKKVESHYRKKYVKHTQKARDRQKAEGHRGRQRSRRRGSRGVYAPIDKSLAKAKSKAFFKVKNYQKWVDKQFKTGLPFWKEEGFKVLYEEQVKRKLRCPLSEEQQHSYDLPTYQDHQKALIQAFKVLKNFNAQWSIQVKKDQCTTLQTFIETYPQSSSEHSVKSKLSINLDLPESQERLKQAQLELDQILHLLLRCSKVKLPSRFTSCTQE